MKKIIVIICFFICLRCAIATTSLPEGVKDVLKKRYPGIEFKIDNSFVINDKTFIPLAPRTPRTTNSIDIIFTVPGKPLPKLIWFSNDWTYARLLNTDDKDESKQTIVSLQDIPEPYKERFLKMQIPDDLVVPENFAVSSELSSLVGELPITTLEAQTWVPGKTSDTMPKENNNVQEKISYVVIDKNDTETSKSNLFLTSPANGKIVHLNLYNSSMTNFIDVMGMPWDLAYNNQTMAIYVTDFFQNKIYEIDSSKPQDINSTYNLSTTSNPKDIEIADDKSSFYILETKDSYFTIAAKDKNKIIFVKKQLALDPAYFTINYAKNLIAFSHPSISKITFLNAVTLEDEGYIEIDGGPSELVNDGDYFYVANRFNDSVIIIDASSKIIAEEMKVDQAPVALELDKKKNHLYVSCSKENTILVIDTKSHKIKDRFPLPVETKFPSDLELSKNGRWLIATSEDSTTISVIDLEGKNDIQEIDVGVPTHSALLIED